MKNILVLPELSPFEYKNNNRDGRAIIGFVDGTENPDVDESRYKILPEENMAPIL